MTTSVKDKALGRLKELGSTDKREISETLKYLDLAGVYLRPQWKVRIVENFDLAIPSFEKVFIVVPRGKEHLINRCALKQLGPATSFVLYPNFPLELRQKIIEMAMEGRSVEVNIIDNGSGQWVGRARHGLESAMTASNEGFRYLVSKYRYHEIFKNGNTIHSEQIDGRVCLNMIAATQYPLLKIGPVFSAKFDLSNIQWLRFDLSHLDNDNAAQWIYQNIAGLPNLQFLHIHCTLRIANPEQRAISFQIISQDFSGGRGGYNPTLIREDGDVRYECKDTAALIEVGNLVATRSQDQAIMDLLMMISRCRKDKAKFPNFPRWVNLNFSWVAGENV
jgi:hypothetical protein